MGRRKSIMFATIPFVIGWSLLSVGSSLEMINIAFLIMGLGVGLKEASSLIYVSEIRYLLN